MLTCFSWTVGPNWPNGGEIDIIEGVNSQSQNDMTLHTSPGCSITNNGGFSGAITATNCDANVAGNTGCQIVAPDSITFGKGFNLNGGGVYATEWTSDAISIWFFPRGSIPSDVSSGAPVPSSWGRPVAEFQGDCKIDTFFKAQQIVSGRLFCEEISIILKSVKVFDTTFCGDWAGNTWSSSIWYIALAMLVSE